MDSPLFSFIQDMTASIPWQMGLSGGTSQTLPASTTQMADATPCLPASDTYDGADQTSTLTNAFESVVYQSQMQQVSFSAQMTEAQALTSDSENGTTEEATFRQLTFDFFSESRTEEIALFRQRSNEVAGSMNNTRAESFTAISQRVEMKFSFSMEISGAALQGFSAASENLPATSDEVYNQFLSIAREALGQAGETLNQLFELLGSYGKSNDFESRVQTLLEKLQSLGSNSSNQGQLQFQSLGISIQMEFSFISEQFAFSQEAVSESDPITFDLDGDGIELTSYADGARFDIQGTGKKVNTAFVTGGDAFLAMDRDKNGSIDSGKELFGDQNGAKNGFDELRKLDSNNDGRISDLDKDFQSLLLWKDNGNGTSEDGELLTLEQAGIKEICLGYRNVDQAASGGNRITQIASFLRSDGTRGTTADVMLSYQA